MTKGNGNKKLVIGALVGTIAGAIAGILFAPRSGKETREMIGDKAKDLKDKGEGFLQDKEKQVGEAWQELKDRGQQVAEAIEGDSEKADSKSDK